MHTLPPGPEHLGLIDTLRSSFGAPAPVIRRLAAQHGDPFRVGTFNGPITFIGNPAAIRAIYTADPETFEPFAVEVTEPIFGRTSVVVSTGPRHRRDRKLLAPPFAPAAAKSYATVVAEVAREEASRWMPCQPFSMLEAMQSIALDVVIRVVFGVKGEARIRDVRAAVLDLIHAMNPLVLIMPAIRRPFGGFGPWARMLRATAALDALLSEEIRALRASREDRSDVLGLMLKARYEGGEGLSDQEILDQLRALLFAGHETTAVTLAWAFSWLHREPDTLARALAEMDALGPEAPAEKFLGLPYLEAVCLETLRIVPPVVSVGRVPRKPFALLDYTIPPGEPLVPSPLLVHGREDLYPEPARFRPTRFLERDFSPFEFIPFGGGSRRCLGATLAMVEMKVVLAVLLREYHLRLASAAPIEHVHRGITMGPRGQVPMIMEGRRVERRPSAGDACLGRGSAVT
ncbi:cytochrome P450 [Polyangium jinanense]|uniref:Cytochrome P450 n=1 Tax=Polyangium jinanense TaxID=2829994 RepID=A0A9X3XEJ0_9BACT|nr:cytochrome P450 [Polyangium jinanense]MDC3959600.1 cytochrome P450 [Polyangium jinanense]MDC3986551.1 cytochrome P450 [Polyangium jinanense]